MTRTDKYNLKKPGLDDLYDVGDFNDNADVIDAALSGHDELFTQLGVDTGDIYGVEIDYAARTITRLGAASDLTAGADFDNIPAWKRQRCIVGYDGTVYKYYGQEGYVETGFYTTTIQNEPQTVRVNACVEQPPFWVKVVPLVTEPHIGCRFRVRKARYYISCVPHEGFVLPSCFRQDESGKVYPAYFSAYPSCRYDSDGGDYESLIDLYSEIDVTSDKLASIVGGAELSSDRSYSGIETDAYKNFAKMLPASGWEIYSMDAFNVTRLLFLIEYASFNAASCIGAGIGSGALPNGTGSTSELGNTSGAVSDGCVSYRGEENLWGRNFFATGDAAQSLETGYIIFFAPNNNPFLPAVCENDALMGRLIGCMCYGTGGDYMLHGGTDCGLYSVTQSDSTYAVRFMYTGINRKKHKVAIYRNVTVSTTDWGSDATDAAFPYSATIPITSVDERYLVSVIFSSGDSVSGEFSPVCETVFGGVKIYAKNVPDTDIIIPTIHIESVVSIDDKEAI